jgi:DnaJ-class molecular chaperone
VTPCPDCDSTRTFLEAEGDGKCSACHGTGWAACFASPEDVIGGEQTECQECQGTGECQRCLGLGIVEEIPAIAAA